MIRIYYIYLLELATKIMKNLIKSITLASVLFLAIFILTGCSTSKTTKFQKPSIKDDFCGPVMNYQYCRCAFHDEYCGSVGMSKSAANSYVREEFNKWVKVREEKFGEDCKSSGGILSSSNRCKYCEDPYVKQGDKCVKAEDLQEEEELETSFVPDGPFDSDCNVNESQFDKEWRKYSDFDNAIDYSSRSWEAQKHLSVYEQIIDLKAKNFVLERDMEIDRQLRLSMREYKTALVQNIKTNLLKSFWRLSYVTYTTIKSAKGLGESYSTVLTSAETIPRISAGLKVIQGVIPGDSDLAIDTKTVSGKVKSAGLNAALEAFDSMGNPVKIATQVFNDAANAPLPSADITPEEIEILRTQHLSNEAIDTALKASYEKNAARRKQLLANKAQIQILEAEALSWQAKEKMRVRGMLEADCQRQKKEFEDAEETSFLDWFVSTAHATAPSPQQYELGEYKVDYDTNEEGDYYLADKLVLSIMDTDEDGKNDLWLQYDDELYLVLEAHDTTGDGNPDTFVELDREELIKNLIQPELVVPDQEEVPDDNKQVESMDESENDDVEESDNSKNIAWIVILLGVGLFVYMKKKK